MPKTALRKEKLTLSFDSALKSVAVKAAKRRGVYPVTIQENLVRENSICTDIGTWMTAPPM